MDDLGWGAELGAQVTKKAKLKGPKAKTYDHPIFSQGGTRKKEVK